MCRGNLHEMKSHSTSEALVIDLPACLPDCLGPGNKILRQLACGALLLPSVLAFATPASCPKAAACTVPFDATLLVSINTVPRHRLEPGETPYLLSTLRALRREADARTAVVIVHSASEYEVHEAFDVAVAEFAEDERFVFCAVGNPVPEATPDVRGEGLSLRIVKQTRDVINTLNVVSGLSRDVRGAKYLLLMEDDFEVCPGAWPKLLSGLAEADTEHQPWGALRVSFGLNGLAVRAAAIRGLAMYLERHMARRAPDHLAVEYFAKETAEARASLGAQRLLVLRENLMRHIGEASTLRPRRGASPSLGCGEVLGPPVLFPVEAFNEASCAADAMVCEAGR
jgi:hypothetical protein